MNDIAWIVFAITSVYMLLRTLNIKRSLSRTDVIVLSVWSTSIWLASDDPVSAALTWVGVGIIVLITMAIWAES